MKLFKITHKLGEPLKREINISTDSTALVGINWLDADGNAYNPDEGSLKVNGSAPELVDLGGVAYTCFQISAGDAPNVTDYDVTWSKTETGALKGKKYGFTFKVVTADRNVAEVDLTGEKYELPVASGTTLGGVKVGENLAIDGNGVLSAVSGCAPFPMAPTWRVRKVDLSEVAWEKVDDTYYGGIYVNNGDVLAFENWQDLPGSDVDYYRMSLFLFPSEDESDVATTLFGFSQNYDTGFVPGNFEFQIQTADGESDAYLYQNFGSVSTTLNNTYFKSGSSVFSYLFVTKSPFKTDDGYPIYIGNRFDGNAPHLEP